MLSVEICRQCPHVRRLGYWDYTAMAWRCQKTSAILVDEAYSPPKGCPFYLEHKLVEQEGL